MNSSVDNFLPAGIRIALCLGLALLCHIIFYQTARFDFTSNIVEARDKTVTVVQLRSADIARESSVAHPSTEASAQVTERVDTLGNSQQLISEAQRKQSASTKQTTNSASKSATFRSHTQQSLKSSPQQNLSKAFSSKTQKNNSTSLYRQESSRQAELLALTNLN